MFASALTIGLSLFFAGLAAIVWAFITFIKEIFGCMGSDNEDDALENDDNDVE